jgi:tripartite-type tricarboxylate transporter receptor subunit TctC
VPYRGVGPAMQDVVAGHIPIVFTSVSTALPNMDQGRIKILAVLEPTRFAKLAHVPSISETIPAFQKPSSWFGYLGPPGLPAAIVARLNEEIIKALNAPDVLPKLHDNGYAVIGGTPDAFAALIRDGIERYGAIIKTAGIQAE